MTQHSPVVPYEGLGESAASIAFLHRMQPNWLWALTCIAEDKRQIETRTFAPEHAADALQWITRWNGMRNLYWSVNPVRHPMNSKAGKEDIACVLNLHVDVDPAGNKPLHEEQERILASLRNPSPPVPPPSVIVFSGGGHQALWRLDTPIMLDGSAKAIEHAEAYNRGLEAHFGGDHCSNIDRLLRLPGTVNIPDKKKIAKGRVRSLARVVEAGDVS